MEEYEFVRNISRGTFSRVQLVRGLESGKLYAVKELVKERILKRNSLPDIKNEKCCLGKLNNPYIVKYYHTYTNNKFVCFVMEYVDGIEMFNIIPENGLNENIAKFYIAEVLIALDYIHSQNYIYRDLKPENIRVRSNGHVCLVDFGFSKEIPPDGKLWTLKGTPDYLPPEMIKNEPYGVEADWWTFGILLYELLAGVQPFTGSHPLEMYENIIKLNYSFPNTFSENAKDLISKLLTFRNQRLCLDKIKQHLFFSGIDWENFTKCKVTPPFKFENQQLIDIPNVSLGSLADEFCIKCDSSENTVFNDI